ncbi:MAG TPA: SLBB domain-containing protein [Smithellaceae bacterium]|nr:SLBB domain-containing protein [Smithellaceae bacterium]
MPNRRFSTSPILIALLLTALFIGAACITLTPCAAQTVSATPSTLKDALAVQAELKKAGIELSPDEIRRGKEALDRQEAQTPAEAVILPPAADKNLTVVEDPKDVSIFHRARKAGNYQDVSVDTLKPFGYDFFHGADIRILTQRRDIPVPAGYVVGPGDQINILLWGRVSARHTLTVDRDGKITVPDIGPIQVAGMTFEQASERLIGKASQITGTNIDISMGATRTIPIFVLGDVARAGAHTIGALATITDALLLAGGPSAIGSMRRVELRRGDKVVTHFDLYDLFLKGDKSRDVVLQAGDVVFVPVTGPLVGITGNVKRPAIYELKDKFDLAHVIDLAGGVIPSAYTQQMQVERIVRNEKQIVIDINDKTLDLVKNFVLQDADLVKIFPIMDYDDNAVYLQGNVKRPGRYAYQPGMKIRDIIGKPDDLLAETYFDYALIKRENPPGRDVVLIPFHLGRLILKNDEAYNYALTPKDRVFIFNKSLFEDKPFVTVEGEIRGNSSLSEKDAEKTDTAQAARNRRILAELAAMKEELLKNDRFYLYAAKIEEIEEEIKTQARPTPGAMRYLQSELERADRPDLTDRLIKLEKQMQVSRRVELEGNMKVKDAILNAGGLTTAASRDKGQIIRQYSNNEFKTFYFNVESAMADDPRDNLILQDKDRIVIHSIWERHPKTSVFITGDVTNPGTYQFTQNLTVRDLVFKAGNVLKSAYLDEAEITSVRVVDGKMGSLSHQTISLRKALEGDPAHNVKLAPNDRLLVKTIADYETVRFVSLSGQVMFPGRYPFKKGERLSDLLNRAGGFTPHAYLRGAYFTRASARTLQQKGLTEMVDRLEREIMAAGAGELATALSPEEIAAKKAELEQRQKFMNNLKNLKATGRMTIYLADAAKLKNTEYDFELEDGDALHVPEKNNVVNVVGSVMSHGSHLYSSSLNYQDYIDQAGGYSYYADPGNTYVLKVDGSARKISRTHIGWNSARSRWEMTAYGGEISLIEPGDTIVVPEKFERIAWLREIKDISTILMNIAAVTAVMIAAF